MTLPENRSYTEQHEWLEIDGDVATVGITAFAAGALGDVVYLELPIVGALLRGGEECGEIESTKSVSELYAPADGEVLEVNPDIEVDPGAVNLDPFGAGWLFRMRISGAPTLLDAAAYRALIGESS